MQPLDQDQWTAGLLVMLPRGAAWGGSEGPLPGSVMHGYWRAAAAVLAFAHERIADLRAEMFPLTARETYETWRAEYGLGGAGEPYPDLPAKVAALDAPTINSLVDLAALSGWSIRIDRGPPRASARPGLMRIGVGKTTARDKRIRAAVSIIVDQDQSPVWMGPKTNARAGQLKVGSRRKRREALIRRLRLLLRRVMHAHVALHIQLD